MRSESKKYPKILRSRKEKVIFFLDKIEKLQRENEGIIETFYRYNTIKIPDTGQQIDNYDLFKKENYAELRKYEYGSLEKQLELMQEQGFTVWRERCRQVKIGLPK